MKELKEIYEAKTDDEKNEILNEIENKNFTEEFEAVLKKLNTENCHVKKLVAELKKYMETTKDEYAKIKTERARKLQELEDLEKNADGAVQIDVKYNQGDVKKIRFNTVNDVIDKEWIERELFTIEDGSVQYCAKDLATTEVTVTKIEVNNGRDIDTVLKDQIQKPVIPYKA